MMLRITSSKLNKEAAGAATPGNLSVPSSNSEVLNPLNTVKNIGNNFLKMRREEKQRGRNGNGNQSRYPCGTCNNTLKVDSKGRYFCPRCSKSNPII
jgi:hypothetical protein